MKNLNRNSILITKSFILFIDFYYEIISNQKLYDEENRIVNPITVNRIATKIITNRFLLRFQLDYQIFLIFFLKSKTGFDIIKIIFIEDQVRL